MDYQNFVFSIFTFTDKNQKSSGFDFETKLNNVKVNNEEI
uniref:Uncharacterized protein n=1 Tax=Tetranychus urticae TaxID=32264 RepID=T1JQZ0_TETUR